MGDNNAIAIDCGNCSCPCIWVISKLKGERKW